MSDRDRGDSPDGTPDAPLSAAADAGPARARKTTRGRRRSLRVPVDEVPRRASEGGASGETSLDELEPLSSESTVVGVERSEPSLLLPPASGESDDLALELEDDSFPELETPPELDAEPELEAASRAMDLPELEAEPTRVAPRSVPPEPVVPEPAVPPEPAPPPPGVMAPAAMAPAAMAAVALAPVAMDGSLTTPRRPSSVPPPSALGFTVPKIPASPLPSGSFGLEPGSAENGPAETAPEDAPAETAPADSAPLETAPLETAPLETAPLETAPLETAPLETAPVDAAPLEAPPAAASAEAEAAPAEAAPAEAAPGDGPGTQADPVEPPEPRPSRPERMSSPPAGAAAVVVARMVRVTTPPPAPEPAASAEDPSDDEPEISFGDEPLDELQIDFGDDEDSDEHLESRMTDPSIGSAATTEQGDDAEVEVADLADSELDEPSAAPMPPPPPREPARSQPKIATVDAEPQAAAAPAPAEETEEAEEAEEEELADELAADELEVAEVSKPGSTPPPRAEKHAPPPPKAAPPIPAAPKAAEKPAEPSPDAAAEARRARKKANWWEDFFNDDYLRTVPPPNPRQIARQCDFIEGRLKLKPGSTILDVGCGLGLHAIELTRRGYLVVGLDLSLPMLSRAADEAQDEGFRINFLHADMREMNFEGAFDAVLCIGTTFGYFDDDQNRALVERLYRALKPKGVLLLDVVNRDFVFKSQPNLVWFEGDGCVVMEETSANYITSRLQVKRTVILDDGRQRDNTYSVRLYALHELGQILHHRGFRVGEVSGREATPGVFFGADSPRLIIVAERRPQQAAPPTPPGKKAEGTESPSGPSPAAMGEAPADTTSPGGAPAPGAAPSSDDGEPGGSESAS